MAGSKDGSSTVKSQKFCWEDEDIERLIDLYGARPCLWGIADPTYSKKGVREINTIKSKWNSLGAQQRRELAKESKTKSSQSTDDVYESSWPFMEKMRFVKRVKKTVRSTSILKFSDPQLVIKGESEQEDEAQNDSLNSDCNRSLVKKNAKRKRVNPTEQKQKLMAKCIDVLDRPKDAGDPFVLYVSQQLKNLDKRRRLLAEKRINDILFELQFEEFGTPGGGRHFNQHFAHSQPIRSMHNVPVQSSSSYENQVPQQQPQPGTYAAMLQES